MIEDKVLGAGSFGKVFLAHNAFIPDHKVAIKVLDRKKLRDGDSISDILSEFRILAKLDHVNIVKYYETYQDKRYLYLVMEYCPGGDLIEKIVKKRKSFGEQKCAKII